MPLVSVGALRLLGSFCFYGACRTDGQGIRDQLAGTFGIGAGDAALLRQVRHGCVTNHEGRDSV